MSAAQRRVERRTGQRCFVIARVIQRQARGVDHVHVAIGNRADGRFDPKVAAFVKALEEMAPRYGFGFTDRRPPILPGYRAAAYLAAYLAGESSQLREAAQSLSDDLLGAARRTTGKAALACPDRSRLAGASLVRRVVWISPTASLKSGFTMRTCRAIRMAWKELNAYAWAYRPGGLGVPDWIEALRPWMDVDGVLATANLRL